MTEEFELTDWNELFGKDKEVGDLENKVEISLFKKRELRLSEDVDDETITRIIKYARVLDKHNKKPITLYLNTNGGCAYNILRLYDSFSRLKSPIHTIVEGKAFSAGAFIAGIIGNKRSAYKNSSFMMHEVSSASYGKLSDAEVEVGETKRLQGIIFALLKQKTKMTPKDFYKFKNQDWYFDAKTAKKIGLIDEIL